MVGNARIAAQTHITETEIKTCEADARSSHSHHYTRICTHTITQAKRVRRIRKIFFGWIASDGQEGVFERSSNRSDAMGPLLVHHEGGTLGCWN